MSGKPNPTEVTALLLSLQEINRLRDSIADRSRRIEEETKKRQEEINEGNVLWNRAEALIDGMDVKSEGNYGFKGRYHWFILELIAQAETSGVLKCQ